MTGVGTYRKKPVEIEAIQYSGANAAAIAEFVGDSYVSNVRIPVIRTLEGEMRVVSGDWIIKGVKGEFYPCKPDIFNETYDEVDSQIIHRDAGTGEFVTEKYAEEHPDTTVKETNA